jgi:hypothetical protein
MSCLKLGRPSALEEKARWTSRPFRFEQNLDP